MDMEITVIDDSDFVGFAASSVREGEIYMQDVASMVKNIFARLRIYRRACTPSDSNSGYMYNKMSRLNILDHGNKNGLEIGTDWITVATLPQYQPTLALLAANFAAGGFVHLQHCEIGQQRPLMLSLAKTFGAPVYAGTGKHNPVYRFNTGTYVRAEPNGKFNGNAGRP
jgi:hypothetical protein